MSISESVIRLWATASTDNTLLDLHNSSEDTKAEFNNDFINSSLSYSSAMPGKSSVNLARLYFLDYKRNVTRTFSQQSS